jgi:hypothetical protein
VILTENNGNIKKLFEITSSQQEIMKLSAIVLMLLDHVALIYFDSFNFLHSALGRLVVPAFSFMLVYNYIYRTRSKEKYLLNLLILAIISQPIYDYAFEREKYALNILFTLFVGAFFIYIYENKERLQNISNHRGLQEVFNLTGLFIITLTLILLAEYLSYSIFGIITIIMFYVVMKRPSYLTLIGLITSLFTLNISSMDILSVSFTMLFIPILMMIKKTNIEIVRISGKWFYLFYPLHLFVLRVFA